MNLCGVFANTSSGSGCRYNRFDNEAKNKRRQKGLHINGGCCLKAFVLW